MIQRDNLDGLLVDSQNGKTVATVVGHLDYTFASAWHLDGHIFATGNQDKTCRVWDIRNFSKPDCHVTIYVKLFVYASFRHYIIRHVKISHEEVINFLSHGL